MSSYFDDLNRELHELFKRHPKASLNDPSPVSRLAKFFEDYCAIESRVTKTVSLVTGDREFPDDLREKIQGIVAVHSVYPTKLFNPKAAAFLLDTKSSEVFSRLHSAFHEVASRRVPTRFGLLSDDPEGILKRRDNYDVRWAEAMKNGLTHAVGCPLKPCDCNMDRPFGGRT